MYKNKKSGIWYADFLFEGRRYVKTMNVTSKSAAKELEDKFKTEVRSGKYAKVQQQKKQRILFSVAMQDYVDKVGTLQRASKQVKSRSKHLKGFFGNKAITAITPDDVLDYKFKRHDEVMKRAEKLKKPVVFTTINHELKLLRRLFNWYKKHKGIKFENPVEGVEFYREVPRSRILTDEEEQRFFQDGEAPQHVQDVVSIALATGMRRNEILTLKKEDVHLGDIGGVIVLKDTKNGDERKVPLTKGLTELFKRIIDNSLKTSPYLFANSKTGKPISDIKTSFVKSCKRAGIENFHLHDSRHSFCTRLANEGVNPFIIMRIAGHKDTKTAQRYCNPTDEHLMAAMAKLEKKSHAFSQTAKTDNNLDEAESGKSQAVINS